MKSGFIDSPLPPGEVASYRAGEGNGLRDRNRRFRTSTLSHHRSIAPSPGGPLPPLPEGEVSKPLPPGEVARYRAGEGARPDSQNNSSQRDSPSPEPESSTSPGGRG